VKQKVVVADDEAAITELVSCVLEAAGFEVISVYDGPEALAAARRENPSLVLLDVMMPGLDGREVSRRLKADSATAEIPVVLFSAANVDVRTLDADAFISKPFDLDTLVGAAARLARPA
jgi:CheY-like chemotaxis protein